MKMFKIKYFHSALDIRTDTHTHTHTFNLCPLVYSLV